MKQTKMVKTIIEHYTGCLKVSDTSNLWLMIKPETNEFYVQLDGGTKTYFETLQGMNRWLLLHDIEMLF